MTTVSFTDFRDNLAHFLDMAQEDADEIVISRNKGRKAILMSLDEFQSLQETAYLLMPKKNRKHLEKSLKEAKSEKTVNVKIPS